ncbi:streptavidin-V2-like [Saccostrea cucullata]|uniref:streptavidin-V2-like n=1 Tax=Saccostrea cuccullata TaxID=36930 RepID=UPI002ED56BF9
MRMHLGICILVLVLGAVPVEPLPRSARATSCNSHNTQNQCAIAGIWRNQLLSEMTLTCQNGTLSGHYYSAVGNAEKEYDLIGRYVQVNSTEYIVGWSVAYKNQYRNARSVASWTGVYYATHGNIKTHWILASYVDPDNYQKTFNTNQDQFHKIGDLPCTQGVVG